MIQHDEPLAFTPPIKIMKLRESAVIPKPAYPGDACLDLVFAPQDGREIQLWGGETLRLGTGLALEVPPGWEALVRSRSGLAANRDIFVLNSPGTIDSGYRGEVTVILHRARAGAGPAVFAPGDRIAQICFKPVYVPLFQFVTELSPSPRGDQGLGSSGVK